MKRMLTGFFVLLFVYLFTSHAFCTRNPRYTLKEYTQLLGLIISSDNPSNTKAIREEVDGIMATSRAVWGDAAISQIGQSQSCIWCATLCFAVPSLLRLNYKENLQAKAIFRNDLSS